MRINYKEEARELSGRINKIIGTTSRANNDELKDTIANYLIKRDEDFTKTINNTATNSLGNLELDRNAIKLLKEVIDSYSPFDDIERKKISEVINNKLDILMRNPSKEDDVSIQMLNELKREIEIKNS